MIWISEKKFYQKSGKIFFFWNTFMIVDWKISFTFRSCIHVSNIERNCRKKNLTTCERKISSYKPAFTNILQLSSFLFFLNYFVFPCILTAFKIQVLSTTAIKCWGSFRILKFVSALRPQKNCQRLSRNLCILRQQWFQHILTFCQRLWFVFFFFQTCSA